MSIVPSPCIAWQEISGDLLVKLLFLLDNGDKSTHVLELKRKMNTKAAEKVKEAFLTSLLRNDASFSPVVRELQNRVKELQSYGFIELSTGAMGVEYHVIKQDEDLLSFMTACRHLQIPVQNLDEKVKKVQRKLKLIDKETKGNFFLYAENLRMMNICDRLTAQEVHELFIIMRNSMSKLIDETLNLSARMMQTKGMKEALFFYMIRSLEMENKHNRLYTGTFEKLLKELSQAIEMQGQDNKIQDILDLLGSYPSECCPTGYCVIFCMTDERLGSESEIEKVQYIFEECLGFTVEVKRDPTMETVSEVMKELRMQKYHFYDSLVLWFMSHGDVDENLLLSGGKKCPRKEIIDSFSKLKNFNKKPKIFFMASCRGEKSIVIREGEEILTIHAEADGANKDFTEGKLDDDEDHDITAVYYKMDRMVASATLPCMFAFRSHVTGSVYVDTLCKVLEDSSGANISTVLEKTNNLVHQILFNHEKDEVRALAKQGSSYESTLQKSFIIPRRSNSQ